MFGVRVRARRAQVLPMDPWPVDRREKPLARVAKAPGAILNPQLSREVFSYDVDFPIRVPRSGLDLSPLSRFVPVIVLHKTSS
jgi:hypothetical protein